MERGEVFDLPVPHKPGRTDHPLQVDDPKVDLPLPVPSSFDEQVCQVKIAVIEAGLVHLVRQRGEGVNQTALHSCLLRLGARRQNRRHPFLQRHVAVQTAGYQK